MNMNRLKLVLPTPEYKEKLLDYKKEFIENGDSMDGTAGLKNAETFEEWYSTVCDNSKEETVREGLVPSTTYMAVSIDNGHLIGMIDIRHRLNDYLMKHGGHIGYSIRKSERNKGYATEMLALALKECIKLNIEKVLLTCDKDNIASAKTMINNGAKLENEVQDGNRITQRYWITLDNKFMGISKEWKFSDGKNTAIFTTRQVINENVPILYVSHDEEDGAWQFLDGKEIDVDNAAIVALNEIVNIDSTINQLFDLPLGWIACRNSCSEPWRRKQV